MAYVKHIKHAPRSGAAEGCRNLYFREINWIDRRKSTRPITDIAVAALKRTPKDWRMCAYVEACMHPATYVRKLCEQQVRPTFLKTLKEFGKARVKDKDAGEVTAKYWSVTPSDKTGE